ncbi:LysR family transcriptional regulator [Kiloniella antarctica]|uniref:LysR family transcriptional regulator n=1 Tax=Kiloniella antarctica TaxID=1550907 RepID=A0ABW5BN17_9PROT
MKRSTIPSLDDLRAFESVARLGSVRAAAQELALTHGAISRRISKLATDINVQLFQPRGRGIHLTRDGEVLSKATLGAFEQLTDALSEIRSSQANEPIVLSCERSVAMRWLIPRLSKFQDAFPEVDLHLSVGGGTLDFQQDRITLAIRRLDFPVSPDWTVEPMMNETIGPVMQPGMKVHFANHNYIALGSKTRPNAWNDWQKQHPATPRPKEVRYQDHHFLMIEGALNGLGVALCPHVLAKDDLERGRLVAPMGFCEDGSQYGLIHPASLPITKDFELVKRWLLEISQPS